MGDGDVDVLGIFMHSSSFIVECVGTCFHSATHITQFTWLSGREVISVVFHNGIYYVNRSKREKPMWYPFNEIMGLIMGLIERRIQRPFSLPAMITIDDDDGMTDQLTLHQCN